MTVTGGSNQAPLKDELIPEKYHPLRDAKTYAELRRILDRNGKYLSRANIDIVFGGGGGGSVGQGGTAQQQRQRSKQPLVTRDYGDDEANSTCSSSWSVDSNIGGTAAAAAASTAVQQRVWKRERQLSRAQCDETALRYVRQQQWPTQDSSVAGIQWHIDYLDACTQRAEEVKRRFVEKKLYNANQPGVHREGGSVFKVQESESEVFVDDHQSGRFAYRKPSVVTRSDIMDSYPSQLCHEKAEKLQNLIDNLYQLKLEAAELENEALPKIILTDCSGSSPGRNCASCARNETNSVQNNNNPRSLSQDDTLKPSARNTRDNHLKISNSNNNGCYLQPHCNSLKVNNCLSIPSSELYQSEARPP